MSKNTQHDIPRIGITLDAEKPGGYSKFPWYALRENYASSIEACGGLPLPLPHAPAQVDAYLNLIDGLVITGGNFDVDPSYYNGGATHASVQTKDTRTAFEFAITRGALERNMPVLGICGGEQLLNVVLGGTLIQHIPDAIEHALEHEQKNPRNEPGHYVQVEKNTLLYRIVGSTKMHVNTAHHQAVDKPGNGVIINSRSEDGVVEGVEHSGYAFCLGVQWHPEFFIDAGDKKLFEAFIVAALAYRAGAKA